MQFKIIKGGDELIKDFFNAVICFTFHRDLKIVIDRSHEHVVICKKCDISKNIINLKIKNIFLTDWIYVEKGFAATIRRKIFFLLALASFCLTRRNGSIEYPKLKGEEFAFTSEDLVI